MLRATASMTHPMRRFMNDVSLCEDQSVVSDDFLAALRAWGNNTVFDREAKHQALSKFDQEASRFRRQHDWLYRGQVLDADDFRTLRSGGTITLDLPMLSS